MKRSRRSSPSSPCDDLALVLSDPRRRLRSADRLSEAAHPPPSSGSSGCDLGHARRSLADSWHEKALDLLEPLLKIPHYLSPGWLRIDPNFDPLRLNPRFQKLVAASP